MVLAVYYSFFMGNGKLPKNIAQNVLFSTVLYCLNGKQYVTVTISESESEIL